MLSRRTLFAGLGLAALPVAAKATEKATEPVPVKPSFPKGYILPRTMMVPSYDGGHTHSFTTMAAPSHTHGYTGGAAAQVVTHHDVWDGSKFVDLDSVAGRRVIADLS